MRSRRRQPRGYGQASWVPRCRGYGDYRELLRRERLDAVLVTAANHVHAEITVAAAEAGVDVFCEKAMARTAAGVLGHGGGVPPKTA